jgi:glycosyltransferase involved in cell wall biosynthesis
MRIVHAVETIDPATGGPVVVAIALAASQAALGHAVAIASYAGTEERAQVQNWVTQYPDAASLQFLSAPRPGRLEHLLATDARALLVEAIRGADVVHVHGIWRPFNAAAAQAALAARAKLVITPHGMLDPWSLRQSRWKKRLALGLVWRRLLNASSFIHVLNQTEANLMGPLRLRARLRVFPNGIAAEDFNASADLSLFQKACPTVVGRPYVLFLGRLHHKKGLDHLLAAFAILARLDAEVQLVVAGPDEGMRGPVERWIGEYGLAGRVCVVGPLYGAAKHAALAGACCFCLPSRQEGFSMAILEAMACGVPVVISEGCHFPEVAAAGAGYVVSLDANAIAAALERVLRDAAWRRSAGAAGRELVAKHYQWRAIAARMLGAYRESEIPGNAP